MMTGCELQAPTVATELTVQQMDHDQPCTLTKSKLSLSFQVDIPHLKVGDCLGGEGGGGGGLTAFPPENLEIKTLCDPTCILSVWN